MGGVLSWLAGSRLGGAIAKWAAIALTVGLFLAAFRRSAERAGRLAERLEQMEKINAAQRRMLEATTRRPRSRDELARRLRAGRF